MLAPPDRPARLVPRPPRPAARRRQLGRTLISLPVLLLGLALTLVVVLAMQQKPPPPPPAAPPWVVARSAPPAQLAPPQPAKAAKATKAAPAAQAKVVKTGRVVKAAKPKPLEQCLARGSHLLDNRVARCRFGTPDGAPPSATRRPPRKEPG